MNIREEMAQLQAQIGQLEREKQHLISLISHDLRSPFNRLHALLQLLQMQADALPPQQHMYLEKMHIVIADALAMMRNLMDYRSLELNLYTLQLQAISLREVLATAAKNLSPSADRKSIALMLGPIPDLHLQADPYCLLRAIENLLSNAIKFSFEGKKVYLNAGITGNQIWIEVRDEGQGLQPEELSSIGSKFLKLSARPTGGESSTGLGLYIARQLLRQTGWELSVRSEAGKGSTFTATFEQPGTAG
jgi:signal transduction histidine kinase